jgi:hypothetical protein
MERRHFLETLTTWPALGPALSAQTAPTDAPQPLEESHFPSRLHQFVWRNWELANLDRMAQVAGASTGQVEELGQSMGLPPKARLSDDHLRRIYITVIRQNWHLLPNDQLIALLGWDREKFEFTLKEDDFLDHKLGPKPRCEPVKYRVPSASEKSRAAEIQNTVKQHLGDLASGPAEEPFTFIERLTSDEVLRPANPGARAGEGQVDVSGWSISKDFPSLETILRQAIGSEASSTKGFIEIGLSASARYQGETFRIDVGERRVRLASGDLAGLRQGVHHLLDQIEENGGPYLNRGEVQREAAVDPRYCYSYFALYGDPLLEPDLDPFPDNYLERLARLGLNGVWMQGVLSGLARSEVFPEFGDRSEERLANLRELARRVRAHGMKLFLYFNEPRAQSPAFFRDRPEMLGAERQGFHAMCTSIPAVREWVTNGLAHVFKEVPELGGVFTITMSENLTNCHSKFRPAACARCSKRTPGAVVGEVLDAVYQGVRRSSPDAEVIHWDWGWRGDMATELIPKLPKDVRLQSVSEWSIPIERGGVKSVTGEYSISVVGPGPRAKTHWALAKQAGVRTMAKTQFNNTWEISAVPYIPVPNLIARHCDGLRREGVSGLQVSWTLGGYPSPNLEVAKEYYYSPEPKEENVLTRVARRRYGAKAAPGIVKAWSEFSRAFEEFPYGVAIYNIPTQHGPANLLRLKPTGIRMSMLLFPQDDYLHWCRHYPPEVVADQFTKMAKLWRVGLAEFERALEEVPASRRAAAEEDLAIAETCHIHFRSVANQIRFYVWRDRAPSNGQREALHGILRDEIGLARRLYAVARRHSVIAYEATNHYYYRPLDLLEKIVQCEHLLGKVTA